MPLVGHTKHLQLLLTHTSDMKLLNLEAQPKSGDALLGTGPLSATDLEHQGVELDLRPILRAIESHDDMNNEQKD